jgi:hypothetical protein
MTSITLGGDWENGASLSQISKYLAGFNNYKKIFLWATEAKHGRFSKLTSFYLRNLQN